MIGDDRVNSVYAFLRLGYETDAPCLVVCNFTPVPRSGYRVGVPKPGLWREVLNTDAALYGGSNMGNQGALQTDGVASHGEAQSLALTLPPLSVVVLKAEPTAAAGSA